MSEQIIKEPAKDTESSLNRRAAIRERCLNCRGWETKPIRHYKLDMTVGRDSPGNHTLFAELIPFETRPR